MSSGTPSSQVLSRWMAPVSRTSTHVGPNGRVPATHNCGVPDHIAHVGLATQHQHVEVVRVPSGPARVHDDRCAARGRRARTSVAIRVIGVVGQPDRSLPR